LYRTEFKARYNQALAALENARARLDYASLNLKRQQALKKKNFTSQIKVDEAERAYELAESDLKQAKANLDYANIQLGYTRIRAPIPGIVASVSTQEGETVIFAANPEKLEVLSTNPLGERTNSTIAVSDGQIFLRTYKALYCIEE
jgi:multidrug efflux pump subunit AcrA (membrane-fusion protein)